MNKNLGRKKSRSYAMKGGAGPYVYEGVALTLDNQYTHFAVNYNDNGTYNFDIPERNKRFTSFCQLYEYYQENSPISCVHQEFTSKNIHGVITPYKSPSFVDILGIALVLRKIQKSNPTSMLSVNTDKKLLTPAFKTLTLIATVKRPLCWKENGTPHINNDLQTAIFEILHTRFSLIEPSYVDFMSIESLSEIDINAVLRLFKQAIFYYRYGVINSDALLTFESMSTPAKAKTLLTLDSAASETFTKNSKEDEDNWVSKIRLYTTVPLELALAKKAEERAMAEKAMAESDVSEGSKEFEILQSKLSEIAARMKAFGASDDGDGLLIPPPDTPQKKNLQKEYNELRKKVFEILQSKLSEIAVRMEAFGAKPSDHGLLIPPPETPEKKKLQEEYNKLRTEAIITKPPPPPPPPPSSQFM